MTGILARAVLAASGSIDVSVVVKATLVLGLPLLGLRCARGARASVRHAILGATFGVLLILPVAAVFLPRVVVGIPITQVSDSNAPLPVPQDHGTAGLAASSPNARATTRCSAGPITRPTPINY